MTTQTYTKTAIVELLEKSDLAVERGVLAIYARQTMDEQTATETKHQNGVGFNGVDANIMSSFAQQIERRVANGTRGGQCLSEKQMAIARRKIVRYARQLVEIANEKMGSPRPHAPPTKSKSSLTRRPLSNRRRHQTTWRGLRPNFSLWSRLNL
jgi:hypothetical protein